jgi:mercuric reductase
VALVESGMIGGTCVNVGCVPSKTLIRAVEQYYQAAHPRYRGVRTQALGLDWAEVIAQKDELVAELRQSKYLDVLAAYPQISLIQGRARLLGGTKVEIGGQIYQPHKIIIASGASPWAAPIPGLAEIDYLTSTTAMELTQLPASMMVLGANAVGLELAQVFGRAGVQVTVVELLPRIAPFEDEDISGALHASLEEEGMRLIPDFKTLKVEKIDGRYRLYGERAGERVVLEAESLLVATGRRPNTQGLGLEQAGVELGPRGEIRVDETLRTSNADIYAAGDVIGKDMFVYVAAYAGGLAAENALTEAGLVYDAAYLPRVTFTDPQIASAGLTEAQAREQGYRVKVSLLPMAYVPRAQAANDRRGLIKLVVDAASERLLGAHILAAEAGEMIQIAVLAMRFNLSVRDLRQTLFPYLTNVEGIKLAALALEKDVTKLSCCAG